MLEDEVLDLKKERSGKWITHQRTGDDGVKFKGQEEGALRDSVKFKQVPKNKFLRQVLVG